MPHTLQITGSRDYGKRTLEQVGALGGTRRSPQDYANTTHTLDKRFKSLRQEEFRTGWCPGRDSVGHLRTTQTPHTHTLEYRPKSLRQEECRTGWCPGRDLVGHLQTTQIPHTLWNTGPRAHGERNSCTGWNPGRDSSNCGSSWAKSSRQVMVAQENKLLREVRYIPQHKLCCTNNLSLIA